MLYSQRKTWNLTHSAYQMHNHVQLKYNVLHKIWIILYAILFSDGLHFFFWFFKCKRLKSDKCAMIFNSWCTWKSYTQIKSAKMIKRKNVIFEQKLLFNMHYIKILFAICMVLHIQILYFLIWIYGGNQLVKTTITLPPNLQVILVT